MLRTALHTWHQQHNATLVEFGGWHMPLHYGSQIEEHHAVRKHAGIFDVSHMAAIDITGSTSTDFLRKLLANDISKCQHDGKAVYSCMLNNTGGVIDDLIAFRITPNHYRLVVNASSFAHDMQWITQEVWRPGHRSPLTHTSILATQGPNAIALMSQVLNYDLSALKRFHGTSHNSHFISRTGYTGEDGIEIILPESQALSLWSMCIDNGITPIGLGARDSLRLEAGLNLYGNDMTTSTSPLSSNLGWTVSLTDPSRDFIGKQALIDEQQRGIAEQLVGVSMHAPGVLRAQQTITINGNTTGHITSGGFSPTLGHAIGLARIPTLLDTNTPPQMHIERRGQQLPLTLTPPPFI